MEFISKIRWVLVIFVMLFALIFIGWGLSTIARNLFSQTTNTTVVEEVDPISVVDLSSVKFTAEGPIVASAEHRSYTVDVTEKLVTMKVYSEYGAKVLAEKNYTNNAESFESLVQALDKAGATLRFKDTGSEDDYNEKGACPTGKRYVLELDDLERRWYTSCSNVHGTAGGKTTTITKLFEKQIPDFKELVKGTNLR